VGRFCEPSKEFEFLYKFANAKKLLSVSLIDATDSRSIETEDAYRRPEFQIVYTPSKQPESVFPDMRCSSIKEFVETWKTVPENSCFRVKDDTWFLLIRMMAFAKIICHYNSTVPDI